LFFLFAVERLSLIHSPPEFFTNTLTLTGIGELMATDSSHSTDFRKSRFRIKKAFLQPYLRRQSNLRTVELLIEVAFVESVVTRSVTAGPKLLSFDPVHDKVPDPRNPLRLCPQSGGT